MASPHSSLEAALAALRDDQPRDALAALLAAWRATPRHELARMIATLSARLAPDASALRGRSADAIDAWMTRARQPAVDDIPALLDTLVDVPSGEATRRIATLAAWPADPRIDAALLALVERLPFQAKTTRPFWRLVFDRLRTTSDPDVVAHLERDIERIPANAPPTTAQWFTGQLQRLLADLAPLATAPPIPAPPRETLRALDDALAGLATPPRASQDRDALLAAVYAQPDDDGVRLVYADALLERGDPRGELITLQCRLATNAPREPVLRIRERELLREHGDRWLGPLAPIITPQYVFERGFLAMCTIDGRKLDLVRRLAGDPSWATVRRVALRLTQPVDVPKTIAVLRALPTTVRQIEVTAHGLAPAGLARIREAADQLAHLEFCNVTS